MWTALLFACSSVALALASPLVQKALLEEIQVQSSTSHLCYTSRASTRLEGAVATTWSTLTTYMRETTTVTRTVTITPPGRTVWETIIVGRDQASGAPGFSWSATAREAVEVTATSTELDTSTATITHTSLIVKTVTIVPPSLLSTAADTAPAPTRPASDIRPQPSVAPGSGRASPYDVAITCYIPIQIHMTVPSHVLATSTSPPSTTTMTSTLYLNPGTEDPISAATTSTTSIVRTITHTSTILTTRTSTSFLPTATETIHLACLPPYFHLQHYIDGTIKASSVNTSTLADTPLDRQLFLSTNGAYDCCVASLHLPRARTPPGEKQWRFHPFQPRSEDGKDSASSKGDYWAQRAEIGPAAEDEEGECTLYLPHSPPSIWSSISRSWRAFSRYAEFR